MKLILCQTDLEMKELAIFLVNRNMQVSIEVVHCPISRLYRMDCGFFNLEMQNFQKLI